MFEELQAKLRLEGILMGLAGSMLLVSRFNKEFKELLQQRDGIAEIRTRDYDVAWCFTPSRGRLKVARGPFLESGGGHEAYAVDGDTAARRSIRVGVASVEEIEILSGLEEGDTIIISDTSRFDRAERIYLRD